MSVRLSHHVYGKQSVRVSKIKRDPSDPSNHELIEARVNVFLEGDFDAAYTIGDNQNVVATDTCKNTVYVLAKDDPFDTIESFGSTVAKHFLSQYAHVSRASIEIAEHTWQTLAECPHAFSGSNQETPTVRVIATRDQPLQITSGLDDLMIAKTTQSGFANFHRDEFRTLPDATDRILATSLKAEWTYSTEAIASGSLNFSQHRMNVRAAMMNRFVDHYSKSVQETLMLMGQAAIEACDAVESITMTMPNKHHIPFNLAPFDRENNNDVFIVTDEPAGHICATIDRE